MSNQTVTGFSPAVIAAAQRNPSLSYEAFYSQGCDCPACKDEAQRVEYLKAQQQAYGTISSGTIAASPAYSWSMPSVTTSTSTSINRIWVNETALKEMQPAEAAKVLAEMAAQAVAETRVPTEQEIREQQVKAMLERGITPIPDDEITDKGSYVVWNKFDPDCTLILMKPENIERDYSTLERAKAWYGESGPEEIEAQKLRAYPGKRVRVEGWFKDASSVRTRYLKLWGNESRQYLDDYARGHRNSDYEGSSMRNRYLERIEVRDLPAEVRQGYMNRLVQNLDNRGVISYDNIVRHGALISSMFNTPDIQMMSYRDARIYACDYKTARGQLKQLGLMIANAEDGDAGEFIEELDNLHYRMRDTRRQALIEAWNVRCLGGDELVVAGCGHVEREDDVHEVRNGTACDDCFENHYVYVENADHYDHRDNVYRHDDDLYYTYEQRSDDYGDYDEDDDDDSIGGRIKNYSTNVLQYYKADTKINVSQYGDFLMGVELEVVPKRGYRAETATDTADYLCDGYAILKNDGSLDSGGFEIVTAPRGLKEHIERFTKWTPHEKLRAWDPGCCGLHVHMSSKAFSQGTLGKFIEFINAPENDDMIISIAGRHAKTDENAASYCQREGVMQLGNPKKNVAGKSGTRYRMVNTCNLSEREIERLGLVNQDSNGRAINTIELRIFRASLKKERLLAQIEFAHAAVMFCRWSSMRELRQEHFLAWLRKTAGSYPNLAKWFGVKANTKTIDAAPKVREVAEV